MPDEDIWAWSTTATLNSNADTGIAWPEGQPRASVNNSARGMMAALAKDRDLRSGKVVAGGAANALTFFSGLSYATTPVGLTARLKIPEVLVNTGPCTLEMDGLSPVAIKDNLGNTLGGGELIGYQEFRWDGTNWVLMNVVAGFSTGDVKLTIKIVADPGWVLMNDLAIGSAASGAATATDGAVQLFTLLFNNITDAWAPMTTSLGVATTRAAQGSAAAAWTANCRMQLPLVLGRALAAAGAGTGLIARPLGSTAGADTETPTVAKTAAHSHLILMSGAAAPIGAVSGQPPWGRDGSYTSQDFWSSYDSGGGVALNIRDPSLFLNVMIKL